MTATATRITAAEFLTMPNEGRGFELIDGEIRERAMSQASSQIGAEVLGLIRDFVKPRNLGIYFGSDMGFQCFTDDVERVRRADVAFITRDRLTRSQYSSKGYCRIVPDLVVEVHSPNDANWNIHEKRLEWLDAGVSLVVHVDPGDETIHVYSIDKPVRHYNTVDHLTLEPVLQGFSCLVELIFAIPPLAD